MPGSPLTNSAVLPPAQRGRQQAVEGCELGGPPDVHLAQTCHAGPLEVRTAA